MGRAPEHKVEIKVSAKVRIKGGKGVGGGEDLGPEGLAGRSLGEAGNTMLPGPC